MSKHTPMPWYLEKFGQDFVITRADNKTPNIACVYGQVSQAEPGWGPRLVDRDREETRANARLIAAAPKLLEILKRLKSNCEGILCGDLYPSDECFEAMIEIAQKAINYAEGKEESE